MKLLIVLLKFGPEIYQFIKLIIEQVEKGVLEHQIKTDTRRAINAFKNPNRAAAARELNDIMRGK